jgi:hypothetical protein
MDLTELKMRPTHIMPNTEIPEGVEVTRCKSSRRGKRARGLNLTAQHKPHKHRVSWEAAEAQAKPTLAERLGSGEA